MTMDDIYFSKNKDKNKQSSANKVEIPIINPDDSAKDYSADPRAVGFNKKSGGEAYFNYQKPAVEQETYAPYRGNTKKTKKQTEPVYEDVYSSAPAKSKKNKGCFRPLKTFLSAVAIILAAVFVFVSGAAMISGYTKTDLKSNSYVSSSALASNPLVKNVLLIGVDGKTEEGSLRSDSMILVSLDAVHSKIKLSSFMRDSWVSIPDYKYAKLNAACSRGGPQLVVDTIEYNFGVNIDDYILVDFEMFTNIIDALGGVDVEVTQKEAKFINRTTRHTVESGESVHLDGAKALVYCRIRKLDSDHMRTLRQRKVITAIINQTKQAGISALIGAVFDVLPMIETNMSAFEIALLSFRAAPAAIFYDIESARIPTDDLSWSANKNGASVVELDIEANAQYLYDFIYTSKIETEE